MIRYFSVPWDSGQRAVRMGAGPLRLAEALGVAAEEIAPASEWRAEIRTSFELYRALAARVRHSVAAGEFPVVLAGNCGAAIGTAAGLGTADLAVLWFDAHGDYNTPDTTDTGFLDGMCMATLAGRCWRSLAATVPSFEPVAPRRILHVGGRDYSPGEREALQNDVWLLEPPQCDDVTVTRVLETVQTTASRLLVHVDLDVIDPRFGRANHYAVDGGLSPEDVRRVIALAAARLPVAGVVLASYDPAGDPEGRIAQIGASIVHAAAPPAAL